MGERIESIVKENTGSVAVDYAIGFPAPGQHRTSNPLCKQGIFISGSGVRSAWLCHDPENFKKRLRALEEKVARDDIGLTDNQIAAWKRKARDDRACGEIETAYPGAQDTFYVGNLKGVGRIYQQTFSLIPARKMLTTSCMSPKHRFAVDLECPCAAIL